jgi:hypothetical protein
MVVQSSSVPPQVLDRYRNYKRRPLAPIFASCAPRLGVRNQTYGFAENGGRDGEGDPLDELDLRGRLGIDLLVGWRMIGRAAFSLGKG